MRHHPQLRWAPRWLACVVGLLGAGTARAAGQERPITLREAVAEARLNSPDVQAARLRAEAARQGSGAAGAFRWPGASLDAAAVRSDDPVAAFGGRLRQARFTQQDFDPALLNDPAALTDWSAGAQVGWAPFDFAADAGFRAARADAEAAGLGAEWATRAAAFRAEVRYLEAIGAHRRLAAAITAQTAAEADARRADLRRGQGMLTDADVLQARAAMQGARARRIDAERGVADARDRLAVALGWAEGTTPVPVDTAFADAGMPTDTARLADTTGDVVAVDLTRRPDLRASSAGVRAAAARAAQASRARLPRVEGFARIETHAPQAFSGIQNDWTLGVRMTMPLFTGLAAERMAHAASAQRDAAQQDHMGRLREARAEVAEVRRMVTTAARATGAAEAAADAAEEAARLMRLRFDEGLLTTADLLGAEARAVDLRTQATNARLQLHIASARLTFLTDTSTTSTDDSPGGLDR